MSTVRFYILSQSVVDKFPKLKNRVRNSYFYRTLPPLLFDFGRDYVDRRYMTGHILPALAAAKLERVLFVGCKAYTARYGRQLDRAATDYWTTDINPAAAIWGEKDHHLVCDIAKIDDVCAAESFDAVLLNGVIGDGVNDESAMNRTVTAIAYILRPNGILLIGWNSLKEHPDPRELEAVTTYFRHECVLPLPARKTFPDTDHVYDWFVKTNATKPNASAESVLRSC